MTNEEIEKKARKFLFQDCPYLEGTGTDGEEAAAVMLAECSRSLVSQAYEEAMQILDRRSKIAEDGDADTGGAVSAELDEAFVEIRALKGQLESVPV
jgi:hypothetical protein